MVKSIDRRTTSGATKQPDTAEEAKIAAIEANIQIRKRGVRRLGAGARFIGQYFDEAHIRHDVKRGELFGLVRMLAYHQREARWYRRAWGWLRAAVTRTEYVGPDDIWGALARDFEERTVRPAVAAMAERVRKEREATLEEGRRAIAEAVSPAEEGL